MKKMMILLVLCCCFSCKKKHTLKVTVTNVGTGKPMPNNGVSITELTNKVGSIGGGTVTHDFYSGSTDENGELYITKRFDRRYTYEVSVDLPDNWAYVEDVSHTMSVGDKYWKNGMEFKIATAAYLKLSIHNVNCQGAGDTLNLYYLGRQVGGQSDKIVGALIKGGGGAIHTKGVVSLKSLVVEDITNGK